MGKNVIFLPSNSQSADASGVVVGAAVVVVVVGSWVVGDWVVGSGVVVSSSVVGTNGVVVDTYSVVAVGSGVVDGVS